MKWFQDFGALEWAYFVIACIGTVFLLVQIVMMIVGADGGDGDGGAFPAEDRCPAEKR